MDTNELRVRLTCECSEPYVVRARDAGGSIQCGCGRPLAVPNLSRLRALAGHDAYVTNPVEAIAKAQRDGSDPAGERCLSCGSDSAVLYRCHAICESSYVKRSSNDANDLPKLISWFVLPLVLNLLLSWRGKQNETSRHGHDVEISFNLPVCAPCAVIRGNLSKRAAKELMATVPLYKSLLQYYPNLQLLISAPSA